MVARPPARAGLHPRHRAGGHRRRPDHGPRRPHATPTRSRSRPCARRWTTCRWTAASSSARASATRRRCSTSARRSARCAARTAPRRSTSPSIRWRGPTSAPPARPTPSPCSPPPSAAACSTPPTSTWTRSSSGPTARGAIHIDAPVAENLRNIAGAFERKVSDLTVVVLDRDRHQQLIADIREAGARIRLIGDGDLSAGISAAVRGTGVHAVMGIGGAPEGVITAAAMRCLGGEIQARLKADRTTEQSRRASRSWASTTSNRIYRTEDLAPGERDPLQLHRRDRRRAAARRPLLRRRLAHARPCSCRCRARSSASSTRSTASRSTTPVRFI